MTLPDDAPPSATPPRSVSRRRQLRALALVAGVLAAIVVVAALLGRGAGERTAAAPPVAPGSFRPTAQQLKTLTIEPVVLHRFVPIEVADGRVAVNGDRTTPVYSPYSGRVLAVVARAGDRVEQGAPLAIIEAGESADAQSAFRTALAQVRVARAAAERKRALEAVGGASGQEVQQAAADLASGEAALSAARSHLEILGATAASIGALEAGAPAEARTTLRSPIAGVVVDRQLAPGQYITVGGGTPLYTVADLATVWVIGTLGERESLRLRRGQPVAVTTAARPGRVFTTRLDYVAEGIDPVTHRLNVRAVLGNADGALRPEMLATLRIEAGEARSAPAVPAAAVVYEGERAHVWVATGDGTIALRQVRVGLGADGLTEILNGLGAGERVVTHGSLFVDRAARLD